MLEAARAWQAFAPNARVFGESEPSAAVYASAAAPLVDLALQGGCGMLLMYGQTGSGKTMTMGDLQAFAAARLFPPPPADAAAPADGSHLPPPPRAACAVEISAVEVSGRRCRDLWQGCEVAVVQTAAGGAALRGLQAYVATDAAALRTHLARLMAARTTQATSVNATSSRSHALITLRVGVEGFPEGRLTLLDCAGSEWAQDSASHCAKRRREGAEINASLHALKQVVRALSVRSRHAAGGGGGGGGGAKAHVPYRDAVLTRLLRESLEGVEVAAAAASSSSSAAARAPCRLHVVGCISPGAADVEHSTATLRTLMELSGTVGEECTTTTQDVPRLSKLREAAAAEAAEAAAVAAAASAAVELM